MIMTFTVPSTGHTHQVQLKDELVQEYRLTVEQMSRYYSPTIDSQRRRAHNQVSTPVLHILREELPEQDEKTLANEARHIVTAFLEMTLTGRSSVREIRNSNLYI